MIDLFKVNMSPDASDAVAEVLDSGWIGEGPKVKEFTRKLSELWENENVVCTNSCTTALQIALRLFNAGHGDEVITSNFTYPATTCAIKAVGAVPVVVGTDSSTACTSVEGVIHGLTEKTKAVIVVLVGGLVPEKLDKLVKVLARKGIPLIFDAAHALTTTYKDQHISHWADVSCFSFQSIKHLTTGDGGALALKNPHLLEYAQRMTWFGMLRGEDQSTVRIEDWGYKGHMNDISAVIGLANWDIAMNAVKKSQENAEWFIEKIGKLDRVEPPEGCIPSWWVFLLRYPKRTASELESEGIKASYLWQENRKHRYVPDAQIGGTPTYLAIPTGFWVGSEERVYILDKVGQEAS